MVVAWLPGTVAWQPYGPFAEPRRPILSQLPGFARQGMQRTRPVTCFQ